jgi:protein-L-isoaspartate(D-aspartate) O-methyltransferase
LTPRAKVLEIGTGSGYQAAILSCLSRRVYTLERHKELANLAKERLAHLNMSNVMVICDDGTKGLAQQAPFDRIIVTAAAEDVPAPLIGQLREGGVLVMPVGPKDQTQTLIKVIKSDTGLEYIELNKVRFVPLVST